MSRAKRQLKRSAVVTVAAWTAGSLSMLVGCNPPPQPIAGNPPPPPEEHGNPPPPEDNGNGFAQPPGEENVVAANDLPEAPEGSSVHKDEEGRCWHEPDIDCPPPEEGTTCNPPEPIQVRCPEEK